MADEYHLEVGHGTSIILKAGCATTLKSQLGKF